MPSVTSNSEIENVVSGGFCIGCGGCAATDKNIKMNFTDYGIYEPVLSKTPTNEADLVCPFSNKGPHENKLGAAELSDGQKDKLGHYLALYSGYVINETQRLTSSSGGCTTWLTNELLENDLIDYVIHIKPNDQGILFEYAISSTINEITSKAKTRYYPIEVSSVLDSMRRLPGRYAFVGVPCYIKMIKRLAKIDNVINSRLAYTISIFCGHMKSAGFAESLAWQLKVAPSEIKTVDFRHKILSQSANNYGFKVDKNDNSSHIESMSNLLGKDWGMGAFRLKSCDFCDDIVGELADISFGDAWLNEYKYDSRGHNLIIIRNQKLLEIFNGGLNKGNIHIENVTAEQVVMSQDSSFRHRRDGLKYRMDSYNKKGLWYPKKRDFKGIATPSLMTKTIWHYRAWYSSLTHRVFLKAKKQNSIKYYIIFTKAMMVMYKGLNATNKILRLLTK